MRCTSLWLLLAGCGAGLPAVIDPRDVRDASGAPSLDRVADLGGRAARLPGPLGGELPGDGVASIGELLLLSGGDLGRGPTVTIGRHPVEIEAFTTGGIVVRVPPGTPAGDQPIVVEHAGGRAERRFAIRRWAVVVADGTAHLLVLGAGGPRATAQISVPGAREVRFSSDAAVAYVLGDRLTVIDMAAQRAPRAVAIRDLPVAAEHLVVARGHGTSRAALVGRDTIAMIDVSDTLRPAFWSARRLPLHAESVAAEMDDTGKQLALLGGNQVSFVDVSDVAAPVAGVTVDLAPGASAPMGTLLRYSGLALWALLGGNPRNAATGVQPVRLVRVQQGAVDTTIDVSPAGDAVGLAAEQARRVSGSTIHASAMTPMWVACNAHHEGAILRVDGDGPAAVTTSPQALLSMDAGAGAVLGVACRGDRLAVLDDAGRVLDLAVRCPSGRVAVAVQP